MYLGTWQPDRYKTVEKPDTKEKLVLETIHPEIWCLGYWKARCTV